MQKLLSYTFQQNIWRVLPHPDPEVHQWAVELREVNQKKVSFALIDVYGTEPLWMTDPGETDWWTSLTAFSRDCILVHHYRYPELPQPTDLSALSLSSGEVKWTLPNYVLVSTLKGNVLEVASTRDNGLKYSFCNAETGQLGTVPDDNSVEPPIILQQPVRYKKGDMYFDKMSSFLKENFQTGTPAAIDYLDHRPYLVFSYYLYENEKLAQYLMVLTDKKELLLHEKLTDGRSGTGQSTLMLKGSILVYLKNNTEFRSLKLSQ